MTKSNPSSSIEVQTINVPGSARRVNQEKYQFIKNVMLSILPSSSPGLTQKEMLEIIRKESAGSLFPGGERSGWWAKIVQLDLEAKKIIIRENTKPLRWYKLVS